MAGVVPDLLEGVGTFTLTSGEDVRLDDLRDGEAYINDKAADELEAMAGDELRLFIDGQPPTFKVKGVVERGGLAGRDSTLILPLARAQKVFGRAGEINSIVVSNRGDVREGAELSKQVVRKLRVFYTAREDAPARGTATTAACRRPVPAHAGTPLGHIQRHVEGVS